MQSTVERELKLDPDANFALPELPGEPLAPRLFTSTYYDTPARSLARCGITLRRRVEEGVSRWQLKLPRGLARAELEGLGGPQGPPAELDALLVTHSRHGGLEPVATLRTRRVGVRVLAGRRALADVVLDEVHLLDSGRETGAFAELEVELVDGDEGDLERLSRVLRGAGAHRSTGQPKLMRVLDIHGEAPPKRGAPASQHLRYLLERQYIELETYDPGVRLGDDPEDLHRFRVATRRTRALIRASRPLLGRRLAGLSAELGWLGKALGPARDLDVLLCRVAGLVDQLDVDRPGGEAILALIEQEKTAAREVLFDAFGSRRYLELLDRFALALRELSDASVKGDLRSLAVVEARNLRKAHARLGKLPLDAELHALRIKAKHARYAAELAEPVEGSSATRVILAAKGLQDVIGDHQDTVVGEERIRALNLGRSVLAGGRIIELERERRRAARAALPQAWKRFERAAADL